MKLKKRKTKFFTFKNEVYHFLTYDDNNIKKIEETINNSDSLWVNISIFTEIPENIKLAELKELDKYEDIIIEFAKGIERITVNAYDFDSYVFYEKD